MRWIGYGASLLVAALSTLFLAGCPRFVSGCESDAVCVLKDGTPGRCARARDGELYCIFADSTCPSMWRWGGLSAKEIASTCVEDELVPKDGGIDIATSGDQR